MTQELTVTTFQDLLEEAERQEQLYRTKYSQGVSVMAPVELLQQMDRLIERHKELTRQAIILRALRTYLTILEQLDSDNGLPPTTPGFPRGGAA